MPHHYGFMFNQGLSPQLGVNYHIHRIEQHTKPEEHTTIPDTRIAASVYLTAIR
jgi:hypothetical protein